jgi:hypothetical protein
VRLEPIGVREQRPGGNAFGLSGLEVKTLDLSHGEAK